MKPKEAIEVLKGMQNPLQDYAEMVGAPTWACGCQYVYPAPEDYAIEAAIIALEEKENRKWVLVDERSPDKRGDYWVTMRHLDGSITTEKMFWSPDWPHEDAWNEVVVAWQPYYCPEPFVPQNFSILTMKGRLSMSEFKKYHIEESFSVGVAATVWARSEEEAIERVKKDAQHDLLSLSTSDTEVFSAEFKQVTYID